MKKVIICLIALTLVFALSVSVLGAELDYKGSVTALAGNDSTAWGSYRLSDKLELVADYDNKVIRGGIEYDWSDKFGLMTGVRYDDELSSTVGYGGFYFSVPFATNLKLNGFYNYNYEYEDSGNYEASIKITMYENHYLNAGVMGYTGSGAPIYDYNLNNEALLFVRGDFNWQFKKFGIHLKPLLLVKGEIMHDYDFTYEYSERTKFVLNVNNLDDQEMKYRAGVEFKF